MNSINTVIDWLFANIIGENAIFLGIIALLGLLLQKKNGREILTGVVKTILGYYIFTAGSNLAISAIQIINTVLTPSLGVESGIVQTSGTFMIYLAEGMKYLSPRIMPLFIVSWFVHILLVRVFNKYFKAVYLTIHKALEFMCIFMIFFYSVMGWKGIMLYVPVVAFSALWWSISPMLTYKTSMEMTEGGFCLGHGNQFGAFIADKIGGFFGDPEKDDTNNLQLPGFLNIFSDSTLNLTISMIVTFLVTWIIVVFIGNPTALATLNESAGEYNSFVYMIIQGFKFGAGAVILLQGINMFLSSLVPAFQGISEKLIPGSVPAVDCIAYFGFSPISVILSFVSYLGAGILCTVFCLIFKTPIFLFFAVPSAFFDSASIGVFANYKGGWKAVIVVGFICGLISHIFGGVLAYSMGILAEGIAAPSIDSNFIPSIIFMIFRLFK